MSFDVSVSMTVTNTHPGFEGFTERNVQIAMANSDLEDYQITHDLCKVSSGFEICGNQVTFMDDAMGEMGLHRLRGFAVGLSRLYPEHVLVMDKTNNESSSMEDAGTEKIRFLDGNKLRMYSSVVTVNCGVSITLVRIIEAINVIEADAVIKRELNNMGHFNGGSVHLGMNKYTSPDEKLTVEFAGLCGLDSTDDLLDIASIPV